MKLEIALIASLLFSSPSLLAMACKEKAKDGIEHKILDSEYKTKANPNAKKVNGVIQAKGSKLYCSVSPDTGECVNEAIWFTYPQFVKYKAKYQKVTCSYQFVNSRMSKGVTTSESGIVYFTEK